MRQSSWINKELAGFTDGIAFAFSATCYSRCRHLRRVYLSVDAGAGADGLPPGEFPISISENNPLYPVSCAEEVTGSFARI